MYWKIILLYCRLSTDRSITFRIKLSRINRLQFSFLHNFTYYSCSFMSKSVAVNHVYMYVKFGYCFTALTLIVPATTWNRKVIHTHVKRRYLVGHIRIITEWILLLVALYRGSRVSSALHAHKGLPLAIWAWAKSTYSHLICMYVSVCGTMST